MSARELPEPCRHASTAWAYRISSHADDDRGDRSRRLCSVWVCARPECIERGKQYVAYHALCTPLVIDGNTRQVVSA